MIQRIQGIVASYRTIYIFPFFSMIDSMVCTLIITMNDNLFIIFEKIFILQKVESIVCEQIIAIEYHDVYNVTREFLLKNSCLICHLCRNCQENALGPSCEQRSDLTVPYDLHARDKESSIKARFLSRRRIEAFIMQLRFVFVLTFPRSFLWPTFSLIVSFGTRNFIVCLLYLDRML